MILRTLAVLLTLAAGTGGQTSIVYVQSGEGIRSFTVDIRTGSVTWRGTLSTPGHSPYYLRPSPDNKFLYSAGSDGLLGFSIAGDGSLTTASRVTSAGGPCYVDVHPSGRWAATANYGGGTTLLCPVAGEKGEPVSQPSGAQSHSTRFHPSGRFLYTLSVGDRKITRFKFHEATGLMTPWELSMEGLGPRHITFSPNGDFAYVVHERPIRVSSLKVDHETGKLKPIGDWSALPPKAAEKKELAAAEIAVTPSGKFVYASVRDFSKEADLNGLAVYSVNGSGELSQVEFVPSKGVSPRGFVIDPSGTLLILLNEVSKSLRVFRIDPDSGRLCPVGDEVPVRGQAIGIAWVTL
jgi:6-phosphogluconolactonase